MKLSDRSLYLCKIALHTTRFTCPECQIPVTARAFELHCSRKHGLDPRTRCVWCKSETWDAKNYQHLTVCFKKFANRIADPNSARSIRTRVSHSRCIACLAVGADGFTLFDGRTSVTHDKSLDHSKLFCEVTSMGVGLLYAADDRSLAKWKDVAQSYSFEGEIRVEKPDVEMAESCMHCGSKNCHRWRAVECLSQTLNFEFDHAEH